MTAKGYIGLVLLGLGFLWALILTFQPAPGGAGVRGAGLNPITALIEALAKLAEALAKLFGTRFGAPGLLMIFGFTLLVWDFAD